MFSTLLFVFLVWLPVATTLQAVVISTPSDFTHWWKKALFSILAAPALAASFLTAIAVRNSKTVSKLEHLGEWFKN